MTGNRQWKRDRRAEAQAKPRCRPDRREPRRRAPIPTSTITSARSMPPGCSSPSIAPINKDTEMHPLVRWQFRGGIEEKDRKAFLFTNVVDCKGRSYDIPVAVGVLAANREIYRIGIGCRLDEIDARWVKAARHTRSRRASSRTRRATRSSSPARRSTSPATASTAFRCRSRRRAGMSRLTRRCRNTSPRIPTPASRTWATTAAR